MSQAISSTGSKVVNGNLDFMPTSLTGAWRLPLKLTRRQDCPRLRLTRSSGRYVPEKLVVQSTEVPHPTNLPTPDAVSVPLEFSVNVTDVRVNTQVEQVPSAAGGQLKVPVQVAVEPDPVAVTLRMVPSVHASLVIRSLPDTDIGSVPAGTTVLPAPGHVIEKGPLQVLAKPASRGVMPSLPPPQLAINRATARQVG